MQQVGGNTREAGRGVESQSEDDDEHPMKTYRKKIEPNLREYIETLGCCRDVADQLFDNPPGRTSTSHYSFPHSSASHLMLELSSLCCDNCTKTNVSTSPSVSPALSDMHMENSGGPESTSPNENKARISHRTQQHLQNVHVALLAWRLATR